MPPPSESDRRPAWVWTNVVANYPEDPYGRDVAYLRDPGGEIRRQFDEAGAAGAGCLRIQMIQGNPTGQALYPMTCGPSVILQPAWEALQDCVPAWVSQGRKFDLYTGIIQTVQHDSLTTAGARIFSPYSKDGPAYWAANLQPWVDIGMSRLWLDTGADHIYHIRRMRKFAPTVEFGGEAIAKKSVGKAQGYPGDVVYDPDQVVLNELPCVAEMSTMWTFDPHRRWFFSEQPWHVRVLYNDWYFMDHQTFQMRLSDEDIILEIENFRRRGCIVDGQSRRPAVTAAIHGVTNA